MLGGVQCAGSIFARVLSMGEYSSECSCFPLLRRVMSLIVYLAMVRRLNSFLVYGLL